MHKRKLACVMFAVAMMLGADDVWAQTGVGTIAGTARDATGAVLPGVTVEASSPALIEKVRSVVTDDQGNYKILELRPGTYTVTFTLPGFATFKREGVELTSGFTATVNGEMKVGSLEETVTVTGASPVVDVQNARTQNVMTDQLLRTLPAGGKSTDAFVALTLGARLTGGGDSSGGPGAALDVGGSRGELGRNVSIHGSRPDDLKRMIDGMNYNMGGATGGGWSVTFRVSTIGMQESVIESSGTGEGETNTQLNLVPKDGGNEFRLSGVAAYTNRHLQGKNLNDELRARGATTGASVRKIWDYGVGIGGPIVSDRLWFYSANRWWGAQNGAPGAFWNQTQGTFIYTPDLAREGYEEQPNKDFSGRFTWQATSKHKVALIHFINRQCACQQFVSVTVAPEAAFSNRNRNNYNQTTWTYPATNRLLFTAGATFGFFPYNLPRADGVTPETIAVTELSTGLKFNAQDTVGGANGQYGKIFSNNFNQRFNVAYVTGSHAFKAGTYTQQNKLVNDALLNQAISYDLRFANPVALTQWIPAFFDVRSTMLGVYAQDQWTVRRVTLNYGVRYDQFNGFAPATHFPASRFIQTIEYPEAKGLVAFKDISPRMSAAYDVFGNGKTAIKGAWGRYVRSEGSSTTQVMTPALQAVRSTSRTWSDTNRNGTPDCNLVSPDQNGECGGMADRAFGTSRATRFLADDVAKGWGVRQFNWQGSVALQQELRPGVGVTLGYYSTRYYNLTITDNRTIVPDDHNPYCITTPLDARLPGGGGQQLCGLYNLNPSKFGLASNSLITQSDNYSGEHVDRFDGVDVELNARFPRGAILAGGVSTSSQQIFSCKIIDSPEQGRPGFCESRPPWSAGTQIKLHGLYPLPWGIEASGVLQKLPGIQILANMIATNAQIAPSLGRNLAGCPATGACTATVSIPIVAPYTMFEKGALQLDIRLTKTVRLGKTRVKGMFDVYNLTNDGTVMNMNTTYGSAWLRPTLIHQARLFKFGAEIEY